MVARLWPVMLFLGTAWVGLYGVTSKKGKGKVGIMGFLVLDCGKTLTPSEAEG